MTVRSNSTAVVARLCLAVAAVVFLSEPMAGAQERAEPSAPQKSMIGYVEFEGDDTATQRPKAPAPQKFMVGYVEFERDDTATISPIAQLKATDSPN